MIEVNGRWLLVSLLLVCMAAQMGVGQENKTPQENAKKPTDQDDKERIHVIPFWDSDQSDQVRAALTVIGAGTSLGTLSMRVAFSESVRTISGWPFVFETVLPLNQHYLDVVKDGRPWPDMTRKEPRDLKGPDLGIYLALNQAIHRSDRATADMFERSAEENKNATYTDLTSQPNRYRGKVITITGKMPVLRRVESPRLIRDEISHCYTGWVIGPTPGAPPFCVLFTELPKDVEVSEEFNRKATFQGYFLAHVRFPADKQGGVDQKDVIAPYLIGKTLTVHTKAQELPVVVMPTYSLMWYLVGGIVSVFLLLVSVNVWLRRGDRRIQDQVARLRDKNQPFNLEPDELPPAPSVEPGSMEIQQEPPPR